MIRADRRPVSVQPLDRLTELERETLRMFGSGMSHAKIAAARDKSIVTVRNTIYRVQDKLGLETLQELVVWAVRNGLLDDVSLDK